MEGKPGMSFQPMSSGNGRHPKFKFYAALVLPLLAFILIAGFFTFHVTNLLQSSGFTVAHTYNHRLLITFSGSATQVEQVFHVTLHDYRAPDGHIFYANDTDPLIPATIAPLLQSMSGLNNATRMTHPRMTPRS